MTFNQVVRGSSPRCLIKKTSLNRETFFNARHGRTRTTDNAVGRGSRGPVDLGFERTEAERRPSPRCLIKKRLSIERRFFNVRHGRARTTDNAVGRGARRPGDVWSARTGAERRHEVRWTSALSGPKRSGERVPDVSYLGKILILSCPN